MRYFTPALLLASALLVGINGAPAGTDVVQRDLGELGAQADVPQINAPVAVAAVEQPETALAAGPDEPHIKERQILKKLAKLLGKKKKKKKKKKAKAAKAKAKAKAKVNTPPPAKVQPPPAKVTPPNAPAAVPPPPAAPAATPVKPPAGAPKPPAANPKKAGAAAGAGAAAAGGNAAGAAKV
ncbi:hypothetical protein BDP55DRAFT_167457 [Colletotrichum godetiae]|uniref:Uncharacterized protein n=1 Tax=Colletotrichum godetiae TaxID=1209918 RepID=A0AAJ0ANQ8_9PEZI|nr:uncharacterized protein BDP55DRAFT_167457 [Colletotrichum godetiae]KAK1675061.1 hypothetical protein BDP55DRAFT_167457 [Colletotrichum godetiae]